MKKLIIPALLLTLSFSAIANVELPRIIAPVELVSGEFAEGTLTRLTDAEVAEFLPWAQNAQNQLNRAMKQAQSIPLRERLPHIERAVRSVVSRSEGRQYQMFMRYALNRGLLLVDELEKNSDMDEIGAQESALDILQRSIQIGLSFYESDLNFQRRAQAGDTATVLENARFATAFMQGMYPGVINVLDATAQYRLLYKLIEMVNWDLSRDAQAQRYAEVIVEAHEMTMDLPAQPLNDDKSNLRFIRRLNSLRIINVHLSYQEALRLERLSAEQREAEIRRMENERQAQMRREVEEREWQRLMSSDIANMITGPSYSPGRVVLETYETWSVQQISRVAADGLVLLQDGIWYHPDRLQKLVASYQGFSIGESVLEDYETYSTKRIKYISDAGKFLLEDDTWYDVSRLNKLVDSYGGFRVGQEVAETHDGRSIQTIKVISANGKFLLSDNIWYAVDWLVSIQ